MRSRMMIGVGVALALTACEQTEVREITEDRYLPQPMDTVKITDNYYLDGYISRGAEDIGEGRTLQAVNLFLDGDELYVANFAERCVDVFDVKRLTYKRSISNGERTFVRDIYVEDGHLFVAAGDSREVQVFDKHSGTYLTRLGTGIWPVSNVSWAGCVAATKNFVFVRDSKETNVRVFDRKAAPASAPRWSRTSPMPPVPPCWISSSVCPAPAPWRWAATSLPSPAPPFPPRASPWALTPPWLPWKLWAKKGGAAI